jgi:hypothetical protein
MPRKHRSLREPFVWRFNVASYNKTYSGLQVKSPISLPDFKQIWIFWTDFHVSPQYKCSRKSVECELLWSMWREVQTDGRRDGRTDGGTDGRTEGRTDGHDEANMRLMRLRERG